MGVECDVVAYTILSLTRMDEGSFLKASGYTGEGHGIGFYTAAMEDGGDDDSQNDTLIQDAGLPMVEVGASAPLNVIRNEERPLLLHMVAAN
ncbi:hypothetical protein AMTR_s00003p00269260 [Amborella trichopoda]|uniref:Uncharacterized protein n=1 Tax=Amborella trichopoda TaxID=13333 RepID=W1P0W4_AMBTC|nr:hypothetical protein AMTR_s00003p00269260 [Amborella trichopoda]